MTPTQIIVSIIGLVVFIFSVIISINTFYVAFIKKKDDRLQLVVTKSMAQAFVLIMILQIMQFIIKSATAGKFQIEAILGISADPSFISLFILSIVLLINRKKHSV